MRVLFQTTAQKKNCWLLQPFLSWLLLGLLLLPSVALGANNPPVIQQQLLPHLPPTIQPNGFLAVPPTTGETPEDDTALEAVELTGSTKTGLSKPPTLGSESTPPLKPSVLKKYRQRPLMR